MRGPELPPDPDDPGASAGPAVDDPAAMARLRATFVDSHDGWVDDVLALARPWGFALVDVAVPVGLWWGTRDSRARGHAGWLGAAVPHAEHYAYLGGHLQPANVTSRCSSGSAARSVHDDVPCSQLGGVAKECSSPAAGTRLPCTDGVPTRATAGRSGPAFAGPVRGPCRCDDFQPRRGMHRLCLVGQGWQGPAQLGGSVRRWPSWLA